MLKSKISRLINDRKTPHNWDYSVIFNTLFIFSLITFICLAYPVPGAIDAGSTGADGAFTPVKGALPWDGDNDGIVTIKPIIFSISDGRTFDARNGVFNWTSVNIPSDVTVLFERDRMTTSSYNPPIHFLAQSTITIAGKLKAPGKFQGGIGMGAGAPGGFDGSPPGGIAMGPSSSYYVGSDIGFPPSGGGGDQRDLTLFGSGGAGPIVLAANNSITISGEITAIGADNNVNFNPGGGAGSIRLVSDTVNHTGYMESRNGQGGFWGGEQYGPIRIEANNITGNGSTVGALTVGRPGKILYEGGGSEPRLFIDRLVDKNGVITEFPDWDPTNPEVYKPLYLPKTLVAPFTIFVRAENIQVGKQVRIIAPRQTKTGTLSLNSGNGQIEASAIFDGATDFGTQEDINTIYAELIVP